jgi:outer membrane protein W
MSVQIFLSTAAHVTAGRVHIKAKDSLDPLVIGTGIGYRFWNRVDIQDLPKP